MSSSFSPVDIHPPKSGSGRGGVHPPGVGGGGGRDPNDGSPDYERKLHRARIGLICGMVAVSMIFVTLTVLFFGRQTAVVLDSRTLRYVRVWAPVVLPIRMLLWNTLLLLSSSITLELARKQVAHDMLLAPLHAIVGVSHEHRLRAPWLAVTALLGTSFLLGQWLAWLDFRAHGFHAATSGPSPFFYLLTGAHALHLAGGVLVLCYAAAGSLLHKSIEHKRLVVEVTRWYWHFMGLLWIYVFGLLWLAQ